MTDEERLIELEVRVAYQEKTIIELDEVVRTFATRVEKLERELADLRKSMLDGPTGPADEPPPHY